MRSSLSHLASTTISALLVAACSVTPSPAPVTTPAPLGSPTLPSSATPRSTSVATPRPTDDPTATPQAPINTPTSSPELSGWPYRLGDGEPVFGPDGTAYFLARDPADEQRQNLVALDTAGHVKPGWPVEADPGAYFAWSPVVGLDGSVYIEEHGGLAVGSVVRRLGTSGRDLPGWPFEVPPDFACPAGEQYNTDDPRTPAANDPCYPPSVGVAPNGTMYMTKRIETTRIIAIDPTGEIKRGWPIVLDDQDWSNPALGSDGTVYLVRRPIGSQRWDAVRGVIDDDAELWAFGPDGKRRSGWPVPVPDIGGFLIGPQGDVVVLSLIDDVGELCVNPRRTLFTVIGPDGRTLPGWPRGSTRLASFPVVGADGTVYYVSATFKVYAHDRAGEVKTGWPVAVPGAGGGCGPESPQLAPDGTVYVVGDEVTALSADGRARLGWPYRPAGSLVGPCFDSECLGGPGGGILGPDGTLYLIVYHGDPGSVRAEVIALDRQGQAKPGWPYRVPFNANTVPLGLVAASPDGRLFLQGGDLLVSLDPDGRISQ